MTDQSTMRMNLGIDSVAASKGGVQLGKLNSNNDDDIDLSLSTDLETSMHLKESLESWDLDPKEIQMDKELGKGAFGVVYLGKLRGQTVAIKKLNNQNLEEKNLQSFKTEIEIMSKLRHPNVILFMGACTQQGNLMIVLEYMPRGNLKTLLAKQDIPFKTKMSFAKQISLAMSWLHSNNPPFIHRDLKTSNILVSKNDIVKIADFGLSFIKKDNEEGNLGTVGTPLWMAPEVLSKKPYNEKADLYSFGMIIWEMLTRKTPYGNIHSIEELVEVVVTKEERPPIPEGTPSNLKRLIQKVWSSDPAKRPAFSDLTSLFDLITCSALINLGPVEDKNGLKLWKTNFMKNDVLKDTVSFEDFCNAYCEAGGLKFDAEDITFKCLKSVLSRDEKTVTLEEFGILLQRFGPLDSHEEFLARIVNLLKKSWFHGEISAEQSEKIVMNSPKNGTFLVRFSSDPGSFAITSKSQNGNLKHYRIYHKAGLEYLIGQIECSSLDDIIKKYYKELGLKYPAAGSPYESIFNTEKKKKQQQISSGYQVFN